MSQPLAVTWLKPKWPIGVWFICRVLGLRKGETSMTRTQRIPLIALIAFPSLAVAQVQLEFGPPAAMWRKALQMADGRRLLVGSTPKPNAPNSAQLVVAGVYPYPFTLPTLGGSGNTSPAAAALDPAGNLWIVGYTDSDDLPLVNPIVAQKVPYRGAGFVMELDPAGRTLFATYLAGKQPLPAPYFSTTATAIAIDDAGNVYVGGTTDEPDFPVSGGTNNCHPYADIFGDTTFCSFLTKLSSGSTQKRGSSPSGTLIYSTLLTTGGGCGSGGSACIGRQHAYAGVSSIAVDSDGGATLAGMLGSFYNTNLSYSSLGGGYICRVAPDGSKLLWTRGTPTTDGIASSIFAAQNPTGNIDLFGSYIPFTNNPQSLIPTAGIPGLFAAQLKPDGSDIVWYQNLGQAADVSAAGLVLDSQGNAYLAGTSSSAQFPPTAPAVPKLGSDFVLKLDPFGRPVQPPLRLPRGVIVAPPSLGANGSLMLLGTGSSLLTIPGDYYGLGSPAIVAFANSASDALNAGLFPGALFTTYGFNLPGSAEGVQVRVGGIPARILYAAPGQINLQAPFKLQYFYPSSQPVILSSSAGDISLQLPLAQSLGLFTTDGAHAVALNQDGTVNSPSNPAVAGSIVSLFGTGAIGPSSAQDGVVPTEASAFNPDINKFGAFNVYETPLNILYAGAAPGIVERVFQTNIQMTTPPRPVGEYQIVLRGSGALASNAVQVYLK
jgi:uncharacterized protein (TIGR03437 family)